MWLKPAGEQAFLYGNHIVKAHLRRITEDTPANTGAVIFSGADAPLGYGASAKSTLDCRAAGTEHIVAYHQADVGEYLRHETDLV